MSSSPTRRRGLWRRAVLLGSAAAVLAAGATLATLTLRHAPPAPRGAGQHAAGPVAPAASATRPSSPAAATVAAARCGNVPILVYHYIRLDTNTRNLLGYRLSVAPDVFQQQMDWLRVAGAHPVTPARVMQALAGGAALPPHPVVLTFDDGYDNFATAATPILLHDRFVGTDYVVSGFLGRPAYMSAQQVTQVAAEGMVIGAHTAHHVDLTSVPLSLARIEITASRSMLQELLHRPVLDFAYPYGHANAAVSALVQQAGFRDAVTLSEGTMQCTAQRYALHRTRVLGGEDMATFAAAAGVPAPRRGWRDPWPAVVQVVWLAAFHLR